MKRNLNSKEIDYGFSPKLPTDQAAAQERLLEARRLREEHGESADYLVLFAERSLRAFQNGAPARELPARAARQQLVSRTPLN